MKLLFPIFVSSVLAAPGFSQLQAEEESPRLSSALVTISYEELKSLLKAADQAAGQKEAPKPPVEASLQEAHYHLDFVGGSPKLTVEYVARTYSEGWHDMLLLTGGARLQDAETGGDGDASVVLKETGYAMLASGKGNFSAKLSFSLPEPEKWPQETGFQLTPAAAKPGVLASGCGRRLAAAVRNSRGIVASGSGNAKCLDTAFTDHGSLRRRTPSPPGQD